MDCENQSCGQCKKGRIRLDAHVICGSEDGSLGCERVFHLVGCFIIAFYHDTSF
jgi:bromodomain adjacent to zinc finger domain protein 1A